MTPTLEHLAVEGRFPIFGGRFQPLHNGHVSIIKLLLDRFPKLYLGIVNPDPLNPSHPEYENFSVSLNPFSFWERYCHVEAVMDEHGWRHRVVIVPMWHPRKKLDRELTFLPPKRERFWVVPGIEDAELAKIEDKVKLGETVVDIAPYLGETILAYRATAIRRFLVESKIDWESGVPASMIPLLRMVRRDGKQLVTSSNRRPSIIVSSWAAIHNGHINMLRSIYEREGDVLIGIACPENRPGDQLFGAFGPCVYSYRERVDMICKCCSDDGFFARLSFIPVYGKAAGDPHAQLEEAFLPRSRRWIIPSCDLVTPQQLESVYDLGEDVDVYPVCDISTEGLVAKLIAGDNWRGFVPSSLHTVYQNYVRNLRNLQVRSSALSASSGGTELIGRVGGASGPVYVSYAWGDDKTDVGRKREAIVDQLCEVLLHKGFQIARDKTRMRAGDSIEQFASDISNAYRLIAVISEKSLHSEFCMVQELFRCFRRCDYRRNEFQQRVIALVLDDATPLLSPDSIIRLTAHWQGKADELQKSLASVDPKRQSSGVWSNCDLMCEMIPRLPEMLSAIKDVVMTRGFDAIVASEFSEVIARLR